MKLSDLYVQDRRIDHEDTDGIRDLLVGRQIMEAHLGDPVGPYAEHESGLLVLDDGTRVTVVPNEGCGGCDNGWYKVTQIAGTPNAITRVGVDDSVDGHGDPGSVRLFVFCGDDRFDVVTADGYDNGWYGHGFELVVKVDS